MRQLIMGTIAVFILLLSGGTSVYAQNPDPNASTQPVTLKLPATDSTSLEHNNWPPMLPFPYVNPISQTLDDIVAATNLKCAPNETSKAICWVTYNVTATGNSPPKPQYTVDTTPLQCPAGYWFIGSVNKQLTYSGIPISYYKAINWIPVPWANYDYGNDLPNQGFYCSPYWYGEFVIPGRCVEGGCNPKRGNQAYDLYGYAATMYVYHSWRQATINGGVAKCQKYGALGWPAWVSNWEWETYISTT